MTDKFILGVDIDDTLTSYTERFLSIHANRYGVDPASLQRPTSYAMDCWGWPGIESAQDYLNHHNDYVRNEKLFAKSPAFPYAAQAIRNLREAGAYVKIITTRFCSPEFPDKDLVIKETAKFFGFNRFEYDEFMVSSTKDHIYADVYIDDSPKNVEKFTKMGRQVIVPNTTGYTEATAEKFGVHLGNGWEHIEQLVLGMMAEREGVVPGQEAFDFSLLAA